MAAQVEVEAVALDGAAQAAGASLALNKGDADAAQAQLPRGHHAARSAAQDYDVHRSAPFALAVAWLLWWRLEQISQRRDISKSWVLPHFPASACSVVYRELQLVLKDEGRRQSQV